MMYRETPNEQSYTDSHMMESDQHFPVYRLLNSVLLFQKIESFLFSPFFSQPSESPYCQHTTMV